MGRQHLFAAGRKNKGKCLICYWRELDPSIEERLNEDERRIVKRAQLYRSDRLVLAAMRAFQVAARRWRGTSLNRDVVCIIMALVWRMRFQDAAWINFETHLSRDHKRAK